MGKTVSRYRVRTILVIATLVGALAVLEILFDPLSWLISVNAAVSIGNELSAAKERWQSHEITDYRIDVEGFVPLACVVNATLSMEEGQLVAVEGRGALGDETSGGVPIEPEDWDAPYCSYRQLLVPELFAQVESELVQINWSQDTLVVEFDSEYGYVKEYRYMCCYRRELLNPTCADCSIWFRFSGFEPVTSP